MFGHKAQTPCDNQVSWTYKIAILFSGSTDLYGCHFALRSPWLIESPFCAQVTWTFTLFCAQGRRRGRGIGRTPGWGSAPRRGMGRGCARKPSGLQTALHAGQYVPNAAYFRPKSIVYDWIPTKRNEIKAFLGLCILMVIVSKLRVSMFWSRDSFYQTPILGQVMSRKRFQILQRFLHFHNNQDPHYKTNDPDRNKLFKIRTLMDMGRQKFNSVFYPSENLTVDGSLVLCKGSLLSSSTSELKRQGVESRCLSWLLQMVFYLISWFTKVILNQA